jgi:nucleotide-binding universal stress UspA family protein
VRKNTRYDEVLLHGNASERVLEVAGQIDADLLVIGAQHRTFADSTVIGSTTERIARFAKQPVLTVIRRLAPAGTPVEEDHRLHLV